jgi:hypothetical protein
VVSEDDAASRRALLSSAGATLAGVAALTLAGCGRQAKAGHEAVKKAQPPIQQADIDILAGLLRLERRTVAAYTAGGPLLTRPDARVARQFLDEELQHTGELLSLIKAAGGIAAPRPASFDLGHPSSEAEVLALLDSLERAQIVSYLAAIPRLSPGPVRAAVASILANDAQHLAVLRLTQGLNPVPSAFVSGAE